MPGESETVTKEDEIVNLKLLLNVKKKKNLKYNQFNLDVIKNYAY